jgi:hypothetical protein
LAEKTISLPLNNQFTELQACPSDDLCVRTKESSDMQELGKLITHRLEYKTPNEKVLEEKERIWFPRNSGK